MKYFSKLSLYTYIAILCLIGAYLVLTIKNTPPPPNEIALGSAPVKQAHKTLDIQSVISKNGIKAWLVEDHSVPVISISFAIKGGMAFDPEDKPGVARLVSILLDEGAGNIDSLNFQKKLNDKAISLGFTAGRDYFWGELQTLTKNKDTAFSLLNLAITKPRFDENAIQRMKAANITSIQQSMGKPSWLSARTFNGVLFDGHAYAEPGHGHLKSMQEITKQDLHDFTNKQFTRDGLIVAVAGDITAEELSQRMDIIFSNLPDKENTYFQAPAELKNVGKTILLPLDIPQSFISLGHSFISRNDPDWHAARMMNYILGGGGFESRLMDEIREKRGLTYGVYSSLINMEQANLIQVQMSTVNDKTKEALDLIHQEWQRMKDSGPTEQEVKDAKAYLTGALLLQLTSTGAIANTLNALQRNGRDINYINELNDKTNALTIEQVQKAAQRLLKPDELTTILIGKPTDIEPDITLDQPPYMGLEK